VQRAAPHFNSAKFEEAKLAIAVDPDVSDAGAGRFGKAALVHQLLHNAATWREK
jgi:hypothetical protein